MRKLFIFNIFLCINVLVYDFAFANPTRLKRFSGINQLGRLGKKMPQQTEDNYITSNDLGEGDGDQNQYGASGELQNPIGLDPQWGVIGDSTESDYDNGIMPSTNAYGAEFREPNEPEESRSNEPFHKKVIPWFRRQWGRARNFFGSHYDNLTSG